jgi:serine/threonine-protein kinase
MSVAVFGPAQTGNSGKYQLIAQLGRGGMSEVYLAVARGPAGFNKLAVLKRLLPALAAEPDFLAMFLDEARLAAQLNHPNIVQTNEVGVEAGKYFIAMEYLDGQPLVKILHRLGPKGLPVHMTLRILADACAGLHYAHTLSDFNGVPLGIVHRDVSPHNLFVTYAGHVKVVDFGIAKAASRTTETETGILKGKIAYMSPEQLGDAEIDGRSDVFSLGIVLFEALTRQRMWGDRPRDVEIMRRLTVGDIPSSPRAIAPDLPEDLDRICRRALAADRENRYASALETQKDLEECIARLPQRASEREIGELVSGLFAQERLAMAGVLEKQLGELERPQGEGAVLREWPASTPSGVMSMEEVGGESASPRPVSPLRILGRRRVLLLAGGVAIVLGAVALWAGLSSREHERVPDPIGSTAQDTWPAAPSATLAATGGAASITAEPTAEAALDAASTRRQPSGPLGIPPRRGGSAVSPHAPAGSEPPVAATHTGQSTSAPTYGPLDGRH